MHNPHLYFSARRFFTSFSTRLHRTLYDAAERNVNFEIADRTELKKLSDENKVVVFLSNRTSIIEQFLLNGFFVRNGLKTPSHSFGPLTLSLMGFSDLFKLFIDWAKGGKPRRYAQKITGLYLPVEDQKFFSKKPEWADFISKIPAKQLYVVPVLTLWSKDVKARSTNPGNWLFAWVGKYNLWSTFQELFLALIGRRGLTFRLGLAATIEKERYSTHLYEKFYSLLKEEKTNVVGASLKNWLEMKNETLLELNLPYDFQKEEAEARLEEMATRYSPAFTDRAARFINRILFSVFSKMIYAKEETDWLRRFSSIRGVNLVFIPTHRSYFDHLVLFNLLYTEQVTVPLVVSGDDFNFFPLGPMLRRMGAFFIRRRMKDDPLYLDVFKAYLHKVVESGYNIEFFIEGGRSRSGKMRLPRGGLISMLAEIKRKSRRRIYFVPVAITYEVLREIQSFPREQSKEKSPERKGFLKKIFGLFNVNYGPVYVTFGKPIHIPNTVSDDFPLELSYLIERENYISFSALISAFFVIESDLNAPALPKRMEQLVQLLRRIDWIHIAPSLASPELNVPRIVEKLREDGRLIELKNRPNFYRLAENASPEFVWYKNSISFALAPLFIMVFDHAPEQQAYAAEYLEAVIQGYRKTDRYDQWIKKEELQPWLTEFLFGFFGPFFRRIVIVIDILSKGNRTFASRSEAAGFLASTLARNKMYITADEIHEILMYLEKRGAINNLFAIIPEFSDTERAMGETILGHLEGVAKRS